MRILITGSSGFIGTALVQELRTHGHEVFGVDLKGADLIGDLTDPLVAQWAIDETSPDVVVHLAAQVGRLFGEDDPAYAVRQNAVMSTLVARAAGDSGCRLVYCSTSEIYGDQAESICDEYDGPFALPHNLYGLTKFWGEQVSQLYAPERLTIWRPSMPYGPGAPPGRGRRAMDNMLWQALHDQPIPVHRGAARSWCWLGDVVRGMRVTIESTNGGTFNIGRDDRELSMLDLARMACDVMGASHGLIEEIAAPKRQTVVKRLSTQRLCSIGWRPEVELDEGIKAVAAWVRNFDEAGQPITLTASPSGSV